MTDKPHIILIDNYDSFAHNLARYVRLAGCGVTVVRNDALSVNEILATKPDGIVISPGPCSPNEAGICVDLIQRARDLGRPIPLLGVCLGHQAIANAYGGRTVRHDAPMHGRASLCEHIGGGDPLFKDVSNRFEAARYHSLIADISDTDELKAIAHTVECGALMALRDKTQPIYGIQFHPESILTPYGFKIIENFASIVVDYSRV